MYGKGDQIRAVHTHRDRTPFPAVVPRQFFLRLDKVLENRLRDRRTAHHKANHPGANLFHRWINDHPTLAMLSTYGSIGKEAVVRRFTTLMEVAGDVMCATADQAPQLTTDRDGWCR